MIASKERRLVRTKEISHIGRKISLAKEMEIAKDYHFTGKRKIDIAEQHGIHPSQVWNISEKYEVREKEKPATKIEMEINESDSEFVAFLLTEYQIDFEFKNLLIQSTL